MWHREISCPEFTVGYCALVHHLNLPPLQASPPGKNGRLQAQLEASLHWVRDNVVFIQPSFIHDSNSIVISELNLFHV